MNYNILLFFYQFGSTFPFWATVAVFLSGPVSYVIFPGIVFSMIFYRQRFESMSTFSLFFITILFSWLSARLLKEIFRIGRPFVEHTNITALTNISGYSFPSEHASVYGALTLLLFQMDTRLGIMTLVVSIAILISRMIVGVHYPIDLIVGYALGMGIAYAVSVFFIKYL